MFQFLIGKVKTSFWNIIFSYENKFQFLIGKVKTYNKEHSVELEHEFQFLIGKVKTYRWAEFASNYLCFNSS